MTDQIFDVLEPILAGVAVRPAPTDALLRVGDRTRRRRRTASLAGAAAAVVLVAGVALAAGSVLPDGAALRDPATSLPPAAEPHVTVELRDGFAVDVTVPEQVAVWDDSERVLHVVSDTRVAPPEVLDGADALRYVRERYGREEGCRPSGRAAVTPDGALVLTLAPSAVHDETCTVGSASDLGVVATVGPLERRPTRVLLTDDVGAPTSIAVTDR